MAVNGSSLTGHCSNATYHPATTCNDPASSVLFDGQIPTLAGLDGDVWADQFLVLAQFQYGLPPESDRTAGRSHRIYFDFAGNLNIRRIELTIFNCVQWGIGIKQFVTFDTRGLEVQNVAFPVPFPCGSLVRICSPFGSNYPNPVRWLNMVKHSPSHRIYIAEMAFYNSSSPCPYSTVIPGAPPVSKSKYQYFQHPACSDNVSSIMSWIQ